MLKKKSKNTAHSSHSKRNKEQSHASWTQRINNSKEKYGNEEEERTNEVLTAMQISNLKQKNQIKSTLTFFFWSRAATVIDVNRRSAALRFTISNRMQCFCLRLSSFSICCLWMQLSSSDTIQFVGWAILYCFFRSNACFPNGCFYINLIQLM